MEQSIATGFASRYTSGRWVFAAFWLLALLIYLPAFNAGRVWDFPGLVVEYRRLGFWHYLDRSWSGIAGLYQFTQFVTWLCFKAFGVHPWPWHLLFITLHALDGFLLYRLFAGLLQDSKFIRAKGAALLGGALFVISPYAAEVVVWLPSYHYLQAIALMVGILILVRRFLQAPKPGHALLAAFLFICAIFSLELFYLTPVLTIALFLWYRYGLRYDALIIRRGWLMIVLPQLALFALYFLLLGLRYGWYVPRGAGQGAASLHEYFSTPVKNAFHLLVHGRYWTQIVKAGVYRFADGQRKVFVVVFAALLAFLLFLRKRSPFVLPFAWSGLALMSTYPLSFVPFFVTQYDRYVYFPAAFTYPLIAMALMGIPGSYLRRAAVAVFSVSALVPAVYVSILWGQGDDVVRNLLSHHPAVRGRKVIILNSPEIYRGIPMIGASENHNYNVLSDAVMPLPERFSDSVWEACSYNLEHKNDGAHVEVLDDTTVQVTLNQWGTWWWYSYRGAGSYESEHYRVDMKDGGHTYNLILKSPAENLDLWYCAGEKWKVVNMNIRGREQH